MGKVDEFVQGAVPIMEAMCPDIGSNKWLMGTDELTQLDIHCGAMWDAVYVALHKSDAYSDAGTRANLCQTSPKWIAYIERLRTHPKIAPECMNLVVAQRHAVRAKNWKPDEKCQLSLDVLKGVFPDLP